MMEYLISSKTRRLLLAALWRDHRSGSVRQLARCAGTAYAATHRELEGMWRAGLANRLRTGRSAVFAANFEHPAAGALLELLEDPGTFAAGAPDTPLVLGRLVTLGAPLLGACMPELQGVDWHPLEVTLVEGVDLARRDATVARSLPVVIHRNAGDLDFTFLLDEARQHGDVHAVGLFLELTAVLGDRPGLRVEAEYFRDRRRRKVHDFFLAASSPLQRRLAERNTPELVRRWGFRMNLGMDAFESTFRRFGNVSMTGQVGQVAP